MRSACLSFKDFVASDCRSDPHSFDSAALLGEADHRIANHLALLMGYVRLKTAEIDSQGEGPSREAVHGVLDGVCAQIAAVAKLHRVLAFDSLPGSVDLGQHLHEVCAPFARGLCGAAELIEDYAPGCVVRPDQVLPLSQIAAEAVTNALKHARDDAKPNAVRVQCRMDAAGALRLEIIDSGCGFPADFDPEKDGGFGFRLVRGLSRKLGAQIDFESTTSGVRFCLTLPPMRAQLEPGHC